MHDLHLLLLCRACASRQTEMYDWGVVMGFLQVHFGGHGILVLYKPVTTCTAEMKL